jgi:hypothetical protein
VILQPGDVVLTRGKGWVSGAIRFFTRGLGESRTKVNHVGIVTWGGRIGSALLTEALSKVVTRPLWSAYAGRGEVAIYRRRHTPIEDRRSVARKAEGYVGKRYGYLKIAAHTLDYALLGANVFRRLCRMENYPICSWLAARAWAEVGVAFGVEYAECSPDHVWDYVNGHPEEWEAVHPLGLLLDDEQAAA